MSGQEKEPSKKMESGAEKSEGQAGTSGHEAPIRPRGGFKQKELRTIPENILQVRAKNLQDARQVEVVANFVQMSPMQGRIVHMYRVDFEPELESVRLMRKLFHRATNKVFTNKPIYDDVHECRSAQELPDKVTTVPVALEDEQQAYQVKFTHTGTAVWGAEMLRVYNTHMKNFLMILGFYQPQPGLFVHPQHVTQIGSDIMMLKGFLTSANLHEEGKMLMNLNASHKLVQRKNVLEHMTQIRNTLRGGNLQEALRVELVGKLVVTQYIKRVYRVEDIDFAARPIATFKLQDGQEISYIDYFRTRHGLTVREPNQPLLTVVPNNRRRREDADKLETKLIPEFCNIAGLTEEQRANRSLKMDLIKASQISPNDRVSHLEEFLRDFHNHNEIKGSLQAWGYSYDTEPVRIKAHTLPPTHVGFELAANQPPSAWTRVNPESADFNVTGLAVAPKIPKLAILIPPMPPGQRQEVVGKLRQAFNRVRLVAEQAREIDMTEDDSPATYNRYIQKLPPDVTAAIVIMNNQNKQKYDAIKKSASVERGLITQVVTARLMTDQRKSSGAAVKIAIQIAAKVGGEPWWVDLPLRGSMVCGYDTYHDTANRGRSYGAFLASMNDRYSRWFSKADAHDRLDEMSSQVSANFLQALKKYHELNKKYPDRVFIYRDGVGEGQLEHVFKVELSSIQEAIKSVDKDIRLTMIIVNKRIGARFYMKANQGYANPPPGTVVDHGVTRPERYDFYLVSQSTRHGTVTPTYYNIIHDEAGFTPDIHQRMAYKLCLLYYNWSGTVRVPAPCQYAHKLAFLCGEHLHRQPNARLDDKLHFL